MRTPQTTAPCYHQHSPQPNSYLRSGSKRLIPDSIRTQVVAGDSRMPDEMPSPVLTAESVTSGTFDIHREQIDTIHAMVLDHLVERCQRHLQRAIAIESVEYILFGPEVGHRKPSLPLRDSGVDDRYIGHPLSAIVLRGNRAVHGRASQAMTRPAGPTSLVRVTVSVPQPAPSSITTSPALAGNTRRKRPARTPHASSTSSHVPLASPARPDDGSDASIRRSRHDIPKPGPLFAASDGPCEEKTLSYR
jgi:hypothetical protein